MGNKTDLVNEETVKNKFPEFVKMLEGCMDFPRWGFNQTFYGLSPEFSPSVIYDSEYCRVRFLWIKGDPRDGYDTLDVLYGRLHALDDQRFIELNKKKFHAWHNIKLALNFLDDLTPRDALENQHKWPKVMDTFVKAANTRNMSYIEWKARLHSHVWRHYGFRLFKLFDLNEPKLWEQYTDFLKEYYRIAPFDYNSRELPLENVC